MSRKRSTTTRNPADATLRNVRASARRDRTLLQRVQKLEKEVRELRTSVALLADRCLADPVP